MKEKNDRTFKVCDDIVPSPGPGEECPTDSRDERKPYASPTVTAISLRPEEAVLGHCKTSSSGGPIGTCSRTFCSTIGS